MAITLYDLAGADEHRRFSPYCWRTKMALAHKGLAFTTDSVALRRQVRNRGVRFRARPGDCR